MMEQIEHNLFVKYKKLNQIINNANWIPVSACYLYSEKSKLRIKKCISLPSNSLSPTVDYSFGLEGIFNTARYALSQIIHHN
jgi:hypothetical protein